MTRLGVILRGPESLTGISISHVLLYIIILSDYKEKHISYACPSNHLKPQKVIRFSIELILALSIGPHSESLQTSPNIENLTNIRYI